MPITSQEVVYVTGALLMLTVPYYVHLFVILTKKKQLYKPPCALCSQTGDGVAHLTR